MSKIVSFISQKGGAGKSTATTLTANTMYHHVGLNVAVIDADFPQHSIFKSRQKELNRIKQNERLNIKFKQLTDSRPPYPIFATDLNNCAAKIREIKDQYDLIFVDPPGTLNQEGIEDTIGEINDFFIPIMQDNYSIMSSIELYSILITQVQPNSSNFSACHLFFNRVPAHNQLAHIRRELGEKIPFMQEEISAYSIYERAYRNTLLPIPKGKKESNALFRFTDAFANRLNLQPTAQA